MISSPDPFAPNPAAPEVPAVVRRRRKRYRTETLWSFVGLFVVVALGVLTWWVLDSQIKQRNAVANEPERGPRPGDAAARQPAQMQPPVALNEVKPGASSVAPASQALSSAPAAATPSHPIASTPVPIKRKPVKDDPKAQASILAAQGVMRDFLAVDQVNAKLPFVRVLPGIVERLKQCESHPEMQPTTAVLGPQYIFKDGLLMTTATLNGQKPRAVVFVPTNKGSYVIDADSFLGWSERYITQLLEQKPAVPSVLRAFLRLVPGFNKADSQNWLVELQDKFEDEILVARLNPGIIQDAATRDDLESGARLQAVVTVRFEENSILTANATIDAFLRRGWLMDNELTKASVAQESKP